MNSEPVEKILEQLASGYALPPLSVIALKLLELASDENTPSEEIVKLIGKDPALTVRLLSLANSAALGNGRPAATLANAVMKLGYNQIKLMVLSISLRGAFPMGRVAEFDYELFWRVSLYRALVARSLAQLSGIACPEEAFLGGLTMELSVQAWTTTGKTPIPKTLLVFMPRDLEK